MLYYCPTQMLAARGGVEGMLQSAEGNNTAYRTQKIMLLLLLSLFQHYNESLKRIYSLSTVTT